MKRIINLINLLLIMTGVTATKNGHEPDESEIKAMLRRVLPDSINSIVEHRPMIVYTCGHYGYNWSIVAKEDSSFRVYSGVVRYIDDKFTIDDSEVNRIDTAAFFATNGSLFEWALDSLCTNSAEMKVIPREYSIPLSVNLSIVNRKDAIITIKDEPSFSGSDSAEFNQNLNKLHIIMRYLAQPSIRQYIPDTIIYK